MVVLHFHLASPLYAFCIELRSGLNLLIECFSFSFLAILLSEFILAGTLKEILSKNSDDITNSQSAQLPESTQILIEQEVEKIKQSMSQTWSAKLQKRAAEYWQMVRNENTAKPYETWRNNSPVIVSRKLQMSKINGEPQAQTQLREKQVMFNFQFEIELMRLRAESHEERYKRIDSEMDDIIETKLSGQRKEMMKKLWRRVR